MTNPFKPSISISHFASWDACKASQASLAPICDNRPSVRRRACSNATGLSGRSPWKSPTQADRKPQLHTREHAQREEIYANARACICEREVPKAKKQRSPSCCLHPRSHGEKGDLCRRVHMHLREGNSEEMVFLVFFIFGFSPLLDPSSPPHVHFVFFSLFVSISPLRRFDVEYVDLFLIFRPFFCYFLYLLTDRERIFKVMLASLSHVLQKSRKKMKKYIYFFHMFRSTPIMSLAAKGQNSTYPDVTLSLIVH